MKKILLVLVIINAGINPLVRNTAVAGNPVINRTDTINTRDTVVFDLKNAVVIGSDIMIPVSILINPIDTVFALDFSLKYNLAKLAYDSIVTVASYMQGTPNQDASYRILYTSLSVTSQSYTNDTPLVYIYFDWLTSGQICNIDLDSVKGYLNGTACSVKVTGSCLTVGVPVVDNKDNFFDIFPNPSQGDFTVIYKNSDNYSIKMKNILGKEIYFEEVRQSSRRFQLNLLPGIYFVQLSEGEKVLTQKLVIE
jgi:hypothetical protein